MGFSFDSVTKGESKRDVEKLILHLAPPWQFGLCARVPQSKFNFPPTRSGNLPKGLWRDTLSGQRWSRPSLATGARLARGVRERVSERAADPNFLPPASESFHGDRRSSHPRAPRDLLILRRPCNAIRSSAARAHRKTEKRGKVMCVARRRD